LEAPAPPPSGTFVDLGCGYGPIACTLAARAPQAAVWAVDVNERALDLCRANAADLGLGNLTVAHVDAAPADLSVDLLWSNPPIRIGKAALHALLLTWLGRLADDGTAVLVVQKHLGADSLQAWLTEQGWPATRIGSRAGYRLLQVGRS
jgi:16S rRNA (guanine1207-N2)-methyltransferase